MSSRRRLTWTSLAVLALVGLLGCGERVPRFPADRFPADAWRGEAVPLPLGRVEQDTLDVAAGDHTDWRSLHAGRTGQLVLSLRLYRDQQAPRQGGHLQILNPHKVNVLALELLPDSIDDEDASLWKRYFKAVDNPSRRNLSLQRRLMPVRYWKYLTELCGS